MVTMRLVGPIAQAFLRGPEGFVPAVADTLDRPLTQDQIKSAFAGWDSVLNSFGEFCGKFRIADFPEHLKDLVKTCSGNLRGVAADRQKLPKEPTAPVRSASASLLLLQEVLLEATQKRQLWDKWRKEACHRLYLDGLQKTFEAQEGWIPEISYSMTLGLLKVYPDPELDSSEPLSPGQREVGLRILFRDIRKADGPWESHGLYGGADLDLLVLEARGERCRPLIRDAIAHEAIYVGKRAKLAIILSQFPNPTPEDVSLVEKAGQDFFSNPPQSVYYPRKPVQEALDRIRKKIQENTSEQKPSKDRAYHPIRSGLISLHSFINTFNPHGGD